MSEKVAAELSLDRRSEELGDCAIRILDTLPAGARMEVVDPRTHLVARVDAILAEDARQFPAFAMARKAAVLAVLEPGPSPRAHVGVIPWLLLSLRRHEERRGIGRQPARWARVAEPSEPIGVDAVWSLAVATYERARWM